ncbi:MAG: hypothetical protein ACI4AN_00480 [Muribaculaceae bacterium]
MELMNSFEVWDKEFRAQNLYAFNHSSSALLWLKVRAVCRGSQIKEFCERYQIILKSSSLAAKHKELFNLLEQDPDSAHILDEFLCDKSNEWYKRLNIDDSRLKDDLYNVKYYVWGGNQNNSLDKHLVSRFVKVISNYDELIKAQAEIADNAWNYVLTSWYNNWTSYLIESLFKRHSRVIPAIGEIKCVDFFIDDIPLDLKVTFFPNQYMNVKLKEKLGMGELAWLKREAKKVSVSVNNNQANAQQLYIITERLKELGHISILNRLNKYKQEVINEAKNNPLELMTWLYANQGEMRFGSENRLYVILVDSFDLNESWKMKRAFNLIEPIVKQYIDKFSVSSMKLINFTFKKVAYRSLADALFVIK